MRKDCSAEELALLQTRRFRPYLRAFVANADGVWLDLSSLQGISHLYDVTVDVDVDSKVASFQLHLRRDAGPTRSLSPFRTDSILNRNGDGEFASLLDAGRDVYAQVGIGAIGSTEPLAWHTIAVGTIDSVDLASAIAVVHCRDQGAVFADTYVLETQRYLYADSVTHLGDAAPLQDVLERILQTSGLGGAGVRVLGDPAYVIETFDVNVEPVLDAVLRLVQLPGWDFRWLWSDEDGEFRPTLYDPERETVIPDVILDPSQYIEVRECAIDRTNVRNQILISFGPATHRSRRGPRSMTDPQSVQRYGRKAMHIIEATNGPIKTDAEADAMLGFVLSDLKDPIASLQLVMFPFWPIELHDLVRCTANGRHFDTDVDLAVTKIRHQFGGDKPRTTLFLRGRPAAYYRGWLQRAKVPARPASDREADVDEYLEGVRVERISATQARVSWTRAAGVSFVFAYATTLAATESFPAPTETPTILRVGTDELLVTLPAPGQRTFVQLEPRDDVGGQIAVLGGVRRLTIDPMGSVVGYTYETTEPVAGTGRVTITLQDSGGFVHPTQKVRFRKTIAGVTTDHAASTAPAGTTTSGTYTFDLLLDTKHPTPVEAYWVDVDGGVNVIGSWTFDLDKRANITNLVPAVQGNSARIKVNCDTDTMPGLDRGRYSLDGGGTWTLFTILSDLTATIVLPLAALPQTVMVAAQNALGEWGPEASVELPPFGVSLTAELTALTDTHGVITWSGNNVTVAIGDSEEYNPPPPDDDVVIEGNQIIVPRDVYTGVNKLYRFRSEVNGQRLGFAVVVPRQDPPTYGGAITTAVIDRLYVASVDVDANTVSLAWSYNGTLAGGTFEVVMIRTEAVSPDMSGDIASVAVTTGSTYVVPAPDDLIASGGAIVTYSFLVRVRDGTVTTLRTSEWTHITLRYVIP